MRMKIEVTGIVQGVGFRPFIYRMAVKNRLNGYVKNKGDAGVEIILEGEEHAIKTFLKDLKTEIPPLAQIYHITKRRLKGKDKYQSFTISKSSSEAEHAGSIIPPT